MVNQYTKVFSSLAQFINQTLPCGRGYDWSMTCHATKLGWLDNHFTWSSPSPLDNKWVEIPMRRKFMWLFSPCIIDALSSSVFRAVTIHSCTCDRTAGWFHYAQLGENAYFNLPRGEVTLRSVALANWPFNHLDGWRLSLQPVIWLPAASLFSFCCQHFPGFRV